MALDINKLKEKMEIYFNSDEYKKKLELENFHKKRIDRFKEKIDSKEIVFSDIFLKVIQKHDNYYKDYCYRHGYQPKPNNVLQFLLDFMEVYGTSPAHIEGITCDDFPDELDYYDGFYHQVIFGQGSFSRIFDKNKNLILTL